MITLHTPLFLLIQKTLIEKNITFNCFVVLLILRDGPQKMKELVDLLGISYASMTGLKDKLFDNGWIEIVPNEDRRCCFVRLTEKGFEFTASIACN